MHPLADSLQDFYVDNCCASIVSIIVEYVISRYPPCPLPRSQGQSCAMGDAGDERVHVKGEDRRVDVDVVRVEDLGALKRCEERCR